MEIALHTLKVVRGIPDIDDREPGLDAGDGFTLETRRRDDVVDPGELMLTLSKHRRDALLTSQVQSRFERHGASPNSMKFIRTPTRDSQMYLITYSLHIDLKTHNFVEYIIVNLIMLYFYRSQKNAVLQTQLNGAVFSTH